MDPDDIPAAAAQLRALLTAIDRGDLAASDAQRAHIAGALAALEQLTGPGGTHGEGT